MSHASPAIALFVTGSLCRSHNLYGLQWVLQGPGDQADPHMEWVHMRAIQLIPPCQDVGPYCQARLIADALRVNERLLEHMHVVSISLSQLRWLPFLLGHAASCCGRAEACALVGCSGRHSPLERYPPSCIRCATSGGTVTCLISPASSRLYSRV